MGFQDNNNADPTWTLSLSVVRNHWKHAGESSIQRLLNLRTPSFHMTLSTGKKKNDMQHRHELITSEQSGANYKAPCRLQIYSPRPTTLRNLDNHSGVFHWVTANGRACQPARAADSRPPGSVRRFRKSAALSHNRGAVPRLKSVSSQPNNQLCSQSSTRVIICRAHEGNE